MPFTENQSYVFRLTRRAQITLAFYYGYETEDPEDSDKAPTCTAWYRGEPEIMTVLQRAHLFAGHNIQLQLHSGPLILATVNTDLALGDTSGTIESVIAMNGPMLSKQGRELAELVYAAHVIMPESMSVEEARHFGDRVRSHGDFSVERFRADLQETLDSRTPPETSHLREDYENLEAQYVRLAHYTQQLKITIEELNKELDELRGTQRAAQPEQAPHTDEVITGVPAGNWIEVARTPRNMPIYKIRGCRVIYIELKGDQSFIVYESDNLVYRLETKQEANAEAYSLGDTEIYFVRYANKPYLARPVHE